MQSPQKPWETSQPATSAPLPISGGFNSYGNTGYGTGYNNYNSGYGGYNSGYGGYGGYNSYGGGMNRFGYGGYNSYGSGMYGGGVYGNSMYGMRRPMMMGPDGDMSLTQRMEQSTQSTFQVLDQIVQSFGGFAQMLESTFFATHSSFMAMIGVAEQFGHLRNYLGQVFSIIALYNSAKRFLYRAVGKQPPIDPSELNSDSFKDFAKQGPKPSKKPLIVFLGMVIGLPWLISRLIKHLEKNKPALPPAQIGPADISNLEFCKALYDFQSMEPTDLPFKKGDLIAILSKVDPQTNQPCDWWRGRSQEGRIGIFPKTYVAIIPRKNDKPAENSLKESNIMEASFEKRPIVVEEFKNT
ncbi:Peroxisomal membrane protein PAS20 [Boothiomyces macroporosus]|uniref:Peroxisomal membrane protein PEX13 n=1 Tax=Boothiomyces macroporosus TaxID=261099 RepID=A0AAD5UHP2_9FUNG|nr:Peroxisomal membrane protein PAS20 [Boothiomyces macroporosus]